jgi:hypothetical protein
MKDQEILGMDSALAAAKEMPYGANMPISAALVIEMVERIVELEKEASTQKGLWVTSDDLQAWRLEQQAKGRLDGVAYALNMYCTTMPPNEFPPIGEYYAGQLQAKALKEIK